MTFVFVSNCPFGLLAKAGKLHIFWNRGKFSIFGRCKSADNKKMFNKLNSTKEIVKGKNWKAKPCNAEKYLICTEVHAIATISFGRLHGRILFFSFCDYFEAKIKCPNWNEFFDKDCYPCHKSWLCLLCTQN